MSQIFVALSFILFVFTSCGRSWYIVRHAEKAATGPNMTSDVALTEAGQQRAEALKDILKNEKIAYVFSTNTIRTKSTAQPTADYFHVPTELYQPHPDSAFIGLLRSKKRNSLIIGHSNTVDDIVNKLCGEIKIPADLKDTEYDNLFIVKKKGPKMIFERRKFGKPSG